LIATIDRFFLWSGATHFFLLLTFGFDAILAVFLINHWRLSVSHKCSKCTMKFNSAKQAQCSRIGCPGNRVTKNLQETADIPEYDFGGILQMDSTSEPLADRGEIDGY
jgi:hypothetical protein